MDVLYKTYPYGASRLSNESGVRFSTGVVSSISAKNDNTYDMKFE